MKAKKLLLIAVIIITVVLISLTLYLTLRRSASEDPINGMRFISEKNYELLKDAYNQIDFSGEFEKGDSDNFDFYISQYKRLVSREALFFDKRTQKEYYINEFQEMTLSDIYDAGDYIYYFFDMDVDGTPELCVTDERRFIYIIKYNPGSDEFVLWHEVYTTWIRLLGSKKLWFYSGASPVEYAYYELDYSGEEECSIRFYIEEFFNEEKQKIDVVYLLTLPKYKDKGQNSEMPESMINQAVIKKEPDYFYFRVTEEQWNELTDDFFESKELSKENIKEIRFTYDELF